MKIITGKVYGIDSKILYKKDGSKQIFEEPVIIKDLKGEFKEQIKIQYFNNSSVDENTIFKYQNNFENECKRVYSIQLEEDQKLKIKI